MKRLVAGSCAFAALTGGAAAGVHAVGPVPVRLCSDRGEGKAPITRFSTPSDVIAGRVAFRSLRTFSSRTKLLKSALGTGKDRVYFVKAAAIVRTGAPVAISIVPRDRHLAALTFVRGTGSVGLGLGYPIERLEPCAPGTKAFAYKGKVGPLTGFPGGFVVTRPACVTIVVTSGKATPIRRIVSLGAGACRSGV